MTDATDKDQDSRELVRQPVKWIATAYALSKKLDGRRKAKPEELAALMAVRKRLAEKKEPK